MEGVGDGGFGTVMGIVFNSAGFERQEQDRGIYVAARSVLETSRTLKTQQNQ